MCYTPIQLKKETWEQKLKDSYKMQEVPCGRCLECRQKQVNSWYVRIDNELKNSNSAYFVTLTYEDENIPFSENGLMTLNYKDLQKFFKRLRKYEKNNNIRYYAVGEYGSNTHRPHYHVIIFNLHNPTSIDNTWHDGFIHVGKVTPASIRYTLKYAIKKVGKEWWHKKPVEDDRLPEKALISKGIGKDLLTPQMIDYLRSHLTKGVVVDGTEYPLPRYYQDKIFTKKDKRNRTFKLSKNFAKRYDKTTSPTFPDKVRYLTELAEKKTKKTD